MRFQNIKIQYLAIIVYALILAFCGCGSDRQDNEVVNPESELLKGWQEYRSGNYEAAILAFEKVLDGNASSEALGDAYNGLGWSYACISGDAGINKMNLTTALSKFQKALDSNEANSDAWVGSAGLLLVRKNSNNDLNDAIKAIDKALQGDASYLYRHDYDSKADLYALKAQCYYYLNDIENAKKEAERSLAIESNNNSASTLMMLLE
jgi:tetratricopeptide (TPR) repeat protein